MLAVVFGCKSSERLPATVTRPPSSSGCLSCRWLPRVATISQPSVCEKVEDLVDLQESGGQSASLRLQPAPTDETVERLADVGERVREEMAVGVQGDVDRRVTELRLEELGMGAGRDHQRGVGVPEVVEAEGLRGPARRTAGRKIRAMKLSLRQTAPRGVRGRRARPRSGARATQLLAQDAARRPAAPCAVRVRDRSTRHRGLRRRGGRCTASQRGSRRSASCQTPLTEAKPRADRARRPATRADAAQGGRAAA